MAPCVEKRLFEQWKDGLTRHTGPRADGWMEGDSAHGPAPQHPHRTPMPLRALLQQDKRRERGGRGLCPARRDVRGAGGGEQGGLRQGDQFPLVDSQHRVTSPAEAPANPSLSRGSDQTLLPWLCHPGTAPGAAPAVGGMAMPGCQRCRSVPSSPEATSIPAVPFARRGCPHPSSEGCLTSRSSLP